jgi:hypothetical protein
MPAPKTKKNTTPKNNLRVVVRISDLWQLDQPMSKLSVMAMPAKTAYWISKLAKALDKELTDAKKTHYELVKRYGEEVPKSPGNYKVSEGNSEVFEKEANEFQSIEIEVLGVRLIDFDEISQLQLTPTDLLKLDPIMTNQPTE